MKCWDANDRPFLFGLEQVRLRSFHFNIALHHLAISKLVDDLEDLGPGGVEALVDLFVGLDRHHKFKLLGGHFTLLSGLAIVAAAAAGASPALKAGATFVGAALRSGIARFCASLLTPLESGPAIH